MSALPTTGREWHLTARPSGWPTPADFALREVPVSEPADGRILVRNLYFSVDPYMRGRMNDVKSYTPPFQLDKPMEGGAVGEVIASNAEGFAVGDHVLHFLGWREYAQVPAQHATKVDPSAAPLSAYLGVLGMTGLTAYAGLFDVASFKEGDTVFVSGAAGAVGNQVGQMARIRAPHASSARRAPTRRSGTSSTTSASTRRSTTRTARSRSSCARPPPTASTCTSTTWAASTSKRPSARSTCTAAPRSAE